MYESSDYGQDKDIYADEHGSLRAHIRIYIIFTEGLHPFCKLRDRQCKCHRSPVQVYTRRMIRQCQEAIGRLMSNPLTRLKKGISKLDWSLFLPECALSAQAWQFQQMASDGKEMVRETRLLRGRWEESWAQILMTGGVTILVMSASQMYRQESYRPAVCSSPSRLNPSDSSRHERYPTKPQAVLLESFPLLQEDLSNKRNAT